MKVLRVVTLASATGRYGGPFDTACSQTRLVASSGRFRIKLLAGALPHDAPLWESQAFEYQFPVVYRLFGKRSFVACISWRFAIRLLREVRAADIVHVSFARELIPLLAGCLTIFQGKRLVLQPHGMLTARTSQVHRLVDLVARPIFRNADAIIALTDVERSELKIWSGLEDDIHNDRRYRVIGNPLPYVARNEQEPPVGGSHKAVFIARLEPRKRVSDFVEAHRYASARGWGDVYEVVGPDQGDAQAVRLAAMRSDSFVYRGAVAAAEIDSILSTAGVFVLTSKNEPWGNVLVAALLKGLPVVVTESAALAREVQQNKLGIVVPDGSPETLSEAIHTVLTQSWRTPDQEAAARAFSQRRFDQIAIQNRLLEAYSSVLQPLENN